MASEDKCKKPEDDMGNHSRASTDLQEAVLAVSGGQPEINTEVNNS